MNARKEKTKYYYKLCRSEELEIVSRVNTCLKCDQEFVATAVADGVKFIRTCDKCKLTAKVNARQSGRDYCNNVYLSRVKSQSD